MPVYEYHCEKCDQTFEAIQKISEKPLKKCSLCGTGKVKKLLSNSAFHLKGTGWYKTDYSSTTKAPEKKDAPTAAPAASVTPATKTKAK